MSPAEAGDLRIAMQNRRVMREVTGEGIEEVLNNKGVEVNTDELDELHKENGAGAAPGSETISIVSQ